MSWIHRFIARIGSAIVLFALLATGMARAESVSFSFERTTLTFTHISHVAGGLAVGAGDPALHALLDALGAHMTWQPGDRDVLIATAAPEVISFAAGDLRYSVGALTAQARFAPEMNGSEVFLPFDDLLHALGLAAQGGVLERLLTSIDVEGYGAQAVLVAKGGGVMHARVTTDEPGQLVLDFAGVGTTLDGQRTIGVAGVRTMDITSSGTARDPDTQVILDLDPGTRHGVPQFGSGEFEVAFGANGGAPPLVAPLAQAPVTAAAPPPPPPPSDMAAALATATPSPVSTAGTTAGNATVSGAAVEHNADGSQTVTISVTGNAHYEWHRLRAPDNRFWVDITNAQLTGGPQDDPETGQLASLRIRQIDPQTVRVALSFTNQYAISVSPSATGLVVDVAQDELAGGPSDGSGTVGAVISANEPQATVTPVPPDEYGEYPSGGNDESDWKFAPKNGYVPTNPRLIVIDPGHGGDDRGSQHNGLTEAVLTLDIAKRVQANLISRGWQVVMTRYTDHDVDSTPQSRKEASTMGYTSDAASQLQARDDIANNDGARVFLSIHGNAYINSGPHGTTIYYSKPSDVPFAQTMEQTLDAADLGTADDGIVKSRLYVTLHADMPAILIETAFLSNPDDAAKLSDPAWRQRLAEAIANGIINYAQSHPILGDAQ